MTKLYARGLPSGNQENLPEIIAELKRLKIPYVLIWYKHGGFKFYFKENDEQKFPEDEGCRHICGYSLWTENFDSVISTLFDPFFGEIDKVEVNYD